MPNFTDQTGKIIEVSAPPLRIVSLVPSITELCAYLGLEDRVVGITRFCLYPDRWYRSKTRVGGTKDPDISRILALNPDLVLANKEENTPQSIEALEQAGVPVWVSDIRTFSAALEMIAEVGRLTGKPEDSRHLVSCIEQSGGSVDLQPISAVCLIWNNPIMAAGNDTFIHAMMERAGFTNLIGG
ncbi:MAG: ABC transporter substrate-binding protein, partial [Flavobacteriales bacterium]|nr:ABC transporter substrate-binding protein [Flavobacteriales bacterium]